MTKRIKLTASQVKAICKGTSKAGFVPVVEIDGVVIKLLPEQIASVAPQEQALSLDDYVPWPGLL